MRRSRSRVTLAGSTSRSSPSSGSCSSSRQPPRRRRSGWGGRAIMVDGAGYLVIQGKEKGAPVEIVYPAEGTPLATSPSVLMKAAPNANAGRLFYNWMQSREAQQLVVDVARQYSPHSQTVEKPGVRKLSEIKLMKEDP